MQQSQAQMEAMRRDSHRPWSARVASELRSSRCTRAPSVSAQVVNDDVKASNVLLDAAMGARLYDFGSALAGFIAAFRPPCYVLALPAMSTVPALHLLRLAHRSGRV